MDLISKRDAIELATLNYNYRNFIDFVSESESYTRVDREITIRQALKLNSDLGLIQKKTGIEMVGNRMLQKDFLRLSDLLIAV
jgi:hypothetical protein